ncbi:Hypp9261 [Branchiostoma lanceolatum]|uniref:Hypp9261 protein n=1 Tax=Branchiostoma lanceolatum TaxID=7740 RepID=A0A8K0EL84_BRALA|nr:Hypp9261 [Branchiostoma lanceolatum]
MEFRRFAKARAPKPTFSFVRSRDRQRFHSPLVKKRPRDSAGPDTGKRQKIRFEFETGSMAVTDPLAAYKMELRTKCESFEVKDGRNAWVVRDFNESNCRLREGKYAVVERMRTAFTDANGRSHSFWICSCREASNQRERLAETIETLTEDFEHFVCREEGLYCLHCRLVSSWREQAPGVELNGEEGEDEREDDSNSTVCVLRADPLLALVACDRSRALVGTTARRRYLHCLTCTCNYGVRNCEHVNIYREEEGLDEATAETVTAPPPEMVPGSTAPPSEDVPVAVPETASVPQTRTAVCKRGIIRQAGSRKRPARLTPPPPPSEDVPGPTAPPPENVPVAVPETDSVPQTRTAVRKTGIIRQAGSRKRSSRMTPQPPPSEDVPSRSLTTPGPPTRARCRKRPNRLDL